MRWKGGQQSENLEDPSTFSPTLSPTFSPVCAAELLRTAGSGERRQFQLAVVMFCDDENLQVTLAAPRKEKVR